METCTKKQKLEVDDSNKTVLCRMCCAINEVTTGVGRILKDYQCTKCFFVNAIYIPVIINYGHECQLCYEPYTSFVANDCGHWCCFECDSKMTDKYNCFMCRRRIGRKNSFIRNEFIFDVPDELRCSFAKLYKRCYFEMHSAFPYALTGEVQRRHEKLLMGLIEYFKWLEIISDDEKKKIFSPSSFIDEIWHLHLLDNKDYEGVCNVLCGKTIYHEPVINDKENNEDISEKRRATRKFLLENNLITYEIQRMIWDIPKVSFSVKKINEPFYIRVQTYTSEVLNIPYEPGTNPSLSYLFEYIEELKGIPQTQLRFIFNGNSYTSKSDKTFDELWLKDGSLISYTISMRGC